MNQPWYFEWLTTWEQVWSSAHVERWQSLLERAHEPHVFATPPLVNAWWLAAQKIQNITPCFMWATSYDGAVIFMPLVIVRHGIKNAFLRIMQLAGYAADYHDPISCGLTDDHWPLFWKAFSVELKSRWRGEFDRALLSGLRFRPDIDGSSVIDCAPYIPIGALTSADDFLASLGKSLRGDIRRQLRRLEEIGPVSFRALRFDEINTAIAWLPEILAQHSVKWPASYKLPGFHEALVRAALPTGLLHLSELRAGDAVVSRHLGFYFQRRFYWYMPVYDPVYQSYSPGKLHLYFCVVEAIDRGGEIFDLLRGEEEYKRQWTDRSSELFEVSWHGSAPGSKLRRLLAEEVRPALKRLRN